MSFQTFHENIKEESLLFFLFLMEKSVVYSVALDTIENILQNICFCDTDFKGHECD